MSIASEITRLQGAKSSLATSIANKGVTVPSATKIDGYAALVDQIQQGGGGTVVEENDVNFYDYDGTLVYSYSKTDFLALTAMPANPSHTGLTAQGWNWTLSDAKTYVTSYNILNIGQHYVTSDGKTRLYVHLDSDCLYVSSYWSQSVANGVTIDWGDGSTPETVGGTGVVCLFHAYTTAGDYVVEWTVTSGTVKFGGNADSYRMFGPAVPTNYLPMGNCNGISKIEIGSCAGFESHAFKCFTGLEKINIPIGASAWDNGGSDLFNYCFNLKCVIVPDGVTTLGNYIFNNMREATVICLPKTIVDIYRDAFGYCGKIKRLCFPANCTFKNNYALSQLTGMSQLVLPSPTMDGDKTYLFNGSSLMETLPLVSNNNKIISDTYRDCLSLKSITIPSTITEIQARAFYNCQSLKSVTLPNITTVTNSSFYWCYSLKEINIPSTVTSIEATAFNNDCNLRKITVDATSPPSLANTNAFTGIFPSATIIVPFASLASYKSASNWSSYRENCVGYLATEPTNVDYISSDGTAYINALMSLAEIGKVKIEFRYPNSVSAEYADGAYNQDGKYAIIGISKESYQYKLGVIWGAWNDVVRGDVLDQNWHTIELDVVNKTVKFDSDGAVSINTATIRANTSFSIFKMTNRANMIASDRRSVKIWDVSGNLVRDMIPVKIDGTAYMYDRVDKLVFSNCSSSGSFSYTDL